MARKRTAPRKVKGLPKGGALYSAAGRKTASAMMRQYGSKRGKSIFYALANKRSGKGARGKDRMHNVANAAFAKGSHWPGSGKKGRRAGVGRRRVRG